jgi:DNA-binding response OmpR family regulator
VSEHILVVDDDPDIRDLVALVLADEGYQVLTAANGAEALTEIEHEPPAAMLLDIQMPIMDGWAVVRSMHERGCRVPTIVMTAATAAEERCRELGADACLPKPFSLDDLCAAVKRVHRRPKRRHAPS